MAELCSIPVKPRTRLGKGATGRLRASGNMPAVLYSAKTEPAQLTIELRAFQKLVQDRGEYAVVRLECADDPSLNTPALLKDVQHDPVRSTPSHADFVRIALDENINTIVPVVLSGRAKGVLVGGVLDHQLREVEVECKPLDVPEKIEADITNLGLNENLHVSDLQAPEGVRIVTAATRAVATILQSRLTRLADAQAKTGDEAAPEGE